MEAGEEMSSKECQTPEDGGEPRTADRETGAVPKAGGEQLPQTPLVSGRWFGAPVAPVRTKECWRAAGWSDWNTGFTQPLQLPSGEGTDLETQVQQLKSEVEGMRGTMTTMLEILQQIAGDGAGGAGAGAALAPVPVLFLSQDLLGEKATEILEAEKVSLDSGQRAQPMQILQEGSGNAISLGDERLPRTRCTASALRSGGLRTASESLDQVGQLYGPSSNEDFLYYLSHVHSGL
ncbi:hypothetical protein JD844_013864 [Phrynosoma platyrhinos]|uniref:Uncharacterized protein n=1 Tax=Phrynosoma platyrhinos TaxID=52577 RepID=A0ABQ7TLB7_PHRPL|nr:hypothetical protein JD844_013864 [Phrynosoma platyrhinos]